jgi:hypothetical protein
MPSITLLGPQRLRPSVNVTLRSLGIDGPLASITAGWEERETEDAELRDHVGGRCFNLQLWERCERIFERDVELFKGFRKRKDAQIRLRELYRKQLHHAMDAAKEMLETPGDTALMEPERQAAFDRVRELDRHHADRMLETELEFERKYTPAERDIVVAHRDQIARILEHCEALLIAGGNVAVLLNRMRLFAALELAGVKPIVAWSAGAMVMTSEVVLFQEDTPHGSGYAEVLQRGLDVCPDVVPFPHARKRLHLQDPLRVQMLARRFQPRRCVPMDESDRIDWTGQAWKFSPATRVLDIDGRVKKLRVPKSRRRRK